MSSSSNTQDKVAPTASPPHPANPLFTTRHTIPNDEHSELACFASADIPQGTRLIAEPPLLTIPTMNESFEPILTAYATLSPAAKSDFWTFQSKHVPHLAAFSDKLDEMIGAYATLGNKPAAQRSETERKTYVELGAKIEYFCRAWRIAVRWHAHRYILNPAPDAREADGRPVAGLFLQSSRLRHSCTPNCVMVYNAMTGQVTVHAAKAIRAGEELSISMIGGCTYYKTAAARAERLADTATLSCSCMACSPKSSTFAEQERLRAGLGETADWLGVIHGRLQGGESFGAEELKEVETKVLRVLADLKKVGCADLELVRWHGMLAEVLHPRMEGKELAALAHAKASLAIGKRCWGDDFPDMKGLEAAVEAMEERRQGGK